MTQTIRTIITSLLLATMLLVPLVATASVGAQANIQGSLCDGANLEVNSNAGCDPQGTDEKVNNTIAFVINVFSLVVGVVAVIMIIIGGLKYIISSGDANNITSAKNTILYAIIGLVIVAIAQFIVKFVLSKTASA